MKLLSKVGVPIQSRRDSDGVVLETVTRWRGAILGDAGQTVSFEFDHDPTNDELTALVPTPVDITGTSASGKAALLPVMKQYVLEAQAFDWFNTKAQADGALTAPQKTAVGALNTSLYVRARAAVAAWYGATK